MLLFRVVTLWGLVGRSRFFSLEVGDGFSETLVSTYVPTLRDNPEEHQQIWWKFVD
jgi:hypothetical protein